jgi:hypothetical protein
MTLSVSRARRLRARNQWNDLQIPDSRLLVALMCFTGGGCGDDTAQLWEIRQQDHNAMTELGALPNR